MHLPSRILVYGLLNPIEGELFYIGQTRKRREFRLLEHIEKAVGGSTLPVHTYIRDLLGQGRIPEIFVLERIGDAAHADEVEVRWIRHFSSDHCRSLPLLVTPKTPKSSNVTIHSIRLMNVQHMTRPPTDSENFQATQGKEEQISGGYGGQSR